jgi:8-oxo-dGTP pyrophosphatase MutT (NUDIX family)
MEKQNTFKSASLIFKDKTRGYLMCNEKRKKKCLQVHPIGGKVEPIDKDILETAIREFIEETNYEHNNLYNINGKTKNELVDELYANLNGEKNIFKYIDVFVSKKFAYVHRFYVVKIDKIKSNELVDILTNFLQNHKEGPNKEIDSMCWIDIKTTCKKRIELVDSINEISKISENINMLSLDEPNLSELSELSKMFFRIKIKKR